MYQNILINAHTAKSITLKQCYLFTFWLIYNSVLVVWKQVEVIPVLVCRDHWPENDQTPIKKQK